MVIESERDDSPLDFENTPRRVLGDICFRLDQLTIGEMTLLLPQRGFHWVCVTKTRLNKVRS